jgi:ketosteroid isomerase-like protein
MRNQPASMLSVAILVSALFGCQPATDTSKQGLFAAFESLDSAVRAEDLDSFVSHYVESPFHFPPGAPRNSTRAEIADFLEGKLGLYELQGEPEIFFSDDASMAFVYGTYVTKADESKGLEAHRGRFITIWRKGDDGWQCVVDIWNTDDPRFAHL